MLSRDADYFEPNAFCDFIYKNKVNSRLDDGGAEPGKVVRRNSQYHHDVISYRKNRGDRPIRKGKR